MSTKNFQVVEQIMPFYSTIYSDILGVRMLILNQYARPCTKKKPLSGWKGLFYVGQGDRV
jgi:hypothetical protein